MFGEEHLRAPGRARSSSSPSPLLHQARRTSRQQRESRYGPAGGMLHDLSEVKLGPQEAAADGVARARREPSAVPLQARLKEARIEAEVAKLEAVAVASVGHSRDADLASLTSVPGARAHRRGSVRSTGARRASPAALGAALGLSQPGHRGDAGQLRSQELARARRGSQLSLGNAPFHHHALGVDAQDYREPLSGGLPSSAALASGSDLTPLHSPLNMTHRFHAPAPPPPPPLEDLHRLQQQEEQAVAPHGRRRRVSVLAAATTAADTVSAADRLMQLEPVWRSAVCINALYEENMALRADLRLQASSQQSEQVVQRSEQAEELAEARNEARRMAHKAEAEARRAEAEAQARSELEAELAAARAQVDAEHQVAETARCAEASLEERHRKADLETGATIDAMRQELAAATERANEAARVAASDSQKLRKARRFALRAVVCAIVRRSTRQVPCSKALLQWRRATLGLRAKDQAGAQWRAQHIARFRVASLRRRALELCQHVIQRWWFTTRRSVHMVRVMRHVMDGCCRRFEGRAFRFWLTRVRSRQRREVAFSNVCVRASHRTQKEALHQWRQHATMIGKLSRFRERCVKRQAIRVLRCCFAAWASRARTLARCLKSQHARFAIAWWKVKCGAFHRWGSAVHEARILRRLTSRKQRTLLSIAMRKLQATTHLSCLSRLRAVSYVSTNMERLVVWGRAAHARQMRRVGVADAMRRWRVFSLRVGASLRITHRLLRRQRRRYLILALMRLAPCPLSVQSCFMQRQQNDEYHRQEDQDPAGMVRKWRRLLVGHVFRRAAMYRTRVAFSSWRSCTSEIGIGGMLVTRHRVMFQAVHTLAKWSQQSFSRAFSKWRALTTQWRRQNADVAERHVTNLRERIFRDVAKKKALSAPRYAFYRWRLHCFESAHSLVAIGLMAPTMRAFLGWRGAAALQRRAREALYHVTVHHVNRCMREAMSRLWRNTKGYRALSRMVWTLSNWRRLELSRCMRCWHKYLDQRQVHTMERRAEQQVATIAEQRQIAAETKDMVLKLRSKQSHAQRRRFELRDVREAFTTWADGSVRTRIHERNVQGMVSRRARRLLHTVVLEWHVAARWEKRQARGVSTMVKRQLRALKHAVFTAWRAVAAARKAVGRRLVLAAEARRACAFTLWAETTHTKRRGQRAARWLRRRLHRNAYGPYFAKWRAWGMVTQPREFLVDALLSQTTLSTCFHAWQRLAHGSKGTRHVLSKRALKLRKENVARCFNIWRGGLHALKAKSQIFIRFAIRSTARKKRMQLTHAFTQLMHAAYHAREAQLEGDAQVARDRAERVANILAAEKREAAKSKVFNGWKGLVSRWADRRQRTKMILIRWNMTHLQHAISVWSREVLKSKSAMRVIASVALRWSRLLLGRGFNHFKFRVTEQNRRRAVILKLLAVRRAALGAGVLRAWGTLVGKWRALRLAQTRADAMHRRLEAASSRRHLRAWAAITRRAKQAQGAARLLRSEHDRSLCAEVLRSWRDALRLRRVRYEFVKRLFGRRSQGWVVLAMRQWKQRIMAQTRADLESARDKLDELQTEAVALKAANVTSSEMKEAELHSMRIDLILRQTFSAWQGLARKSRRERDTMRSVLRKVCYHKLDLAMRKWGEVTYTTRRHRTFAKVLLRWDEQREKLRDRFQLWRSAVFCASLFNDYRYKQLLGGVQDDVKLVARHILLSGDSARSRSTSKAATNGAASSNDAAALQNVLDWLFTAVPDALKMTRMGRGDDTSFNLYLVDHSSQELWTLMPGSGNGNVRAPRKRASMKSGITGFCARTLRRLVVEDAQNDDRFAWDVDAYGMPESAQFRAHADGMTGTGASRNRQRRLSIEHRSTMARKSSAAGLGPRAAAELADTVPVSTAQPQMQLVCVPLVSARGACLGVLQARRYTDSVNEEIGSGPFVAHEELVLAVSCVFVSSEIRRFVKAAQHAARLSTETARTRRQKEEVARLHGAVKGMQEIGRKAEHQTASLTQELQQAKQEVSKERADAQQARALERKLSKQFEQVKRQVDEERVNAKRQVDEARTLHRTMSRRNTELTQELSQVQEAAKQEAQKVNELQRKASVQIQQVEQRARQEAENARSLQRKVSVRNEELTRELEHARQKAQNDTKVARSLERKVSLKNEALTHALEHAKQMAEKEHMDAQKASEAQRRATAENLALAKELELLKERARLEHDRAEDAAREAKEEHERAERAAREAKLEHERAEQEHDSAERAKLSMREVSETNIALSQQLKQEKEHAKQEHDLAMRAAREAKEEHERAERAAREAKLEHERAEQEHGSAESARSLARKASGKNLTLAQQLKQEKDRARQEYDRAEQKARHDAKKLEHARERDTYQKNVIRRLSAALTPPSSPRMEQQRRRLSIDTDYGDETPPSMIRAMSTDTAYREPLNHDYRTPPGHASAHLRSVAHAVGTSANVIAKMTPAAHAAAKRLGIDITVPQTL